MERTIFHILQRIQRIQLGQNTACMIILMLLPMCQTMIKKRMIKVLEVKATQLRLLLCHQISAKFATVEKRYSFYLFKTKEKYSKIFQDGEPPLITPCLCSGSLKFVHQECLHRWIKSSDIKRCELCKFTFIMQSKVITHRTLLSKKHILKRKET